MRNLEFSEIARLIRHSPMVELEAKPLVEEVNEWALYVGKYKVHTSTYPFSLLYLFARATKKGIERGKKALPKDGECHVVYAASLERSLRSLRDSFPPGTRLWTQQEYVASFFREQLEAYRKELGKLSHKHYVDPRVQTPSGFKQKIPNPLWSLLNGTLTERESSGVLAVLLAEAGQGKTFTTERLASQLALSPRIPIYIRSAQWSSLAVEDLRSWWKTITNAFRYYHAPIGWVEGSEDEFLRVTLAAGLFCVIFDGFDEYVLRNRGEVRAQEALDALRQLALETGATILVTSRTSFWDTDVTEDGNVDIEGVSVFRLLPFDRAHAENYFKSRLAKKPTADKASDLYSKLLAQNETLAGRGFVLSLVADLVERGTEVGALPKGANLTAWLMRALCERERERQKLPLTVSEQLSSFRLFVAEAASGAPPSTETLELSVSVSSELAAVDRASCIGKLKSHPLLTVTDDKWDITQEQVRYTLLAEHLCGAFTDDRRDKDFTRFVSTVRLDAGDIDALAKTIVDVVTWEVDEGQAQATLAALSTKMLSVQGALPHGSGRKLALAVIMAGIERFFSKGETHEKRTNVLTAMVPAGRLENLTFTGTVSRFDFRGAMFRGCRFEGVAFVNCEFDAATEFRACVFEAIRVLRSKDFGLATVRESSRDPDSDAVIRDEQIAAGKRQYTEDDLKTDFRAALVKFSGTGGSGVRTIPEGKLRSGTFANAKHRETILSELLRDVIAKHDISGISEKGYHVRDEAVQDVRFFVENNVATGALRATFDRVKRRAGLE
jgi:hypothetical protein